MRRRQLATWVAASSLSVAGCLHRVEVDPPPQVEMPEGFKHSADGPLADRWWEDFADPELNSLITRAIGENFQVKAAWARLRQADALAGQAAAGLFPTVDLEGSGGRFKRFFNEDVGSFTTSTYGVSAAASYELDIWGRIRSQRKAANFELEASRDDVEALAMTVAAQVADAWFGLISQKAQKKLLQDQLEANETFLELVTLRFEQGLTSALDVHQQRQQVAATRSRLALVQMQEEVFGNQIAVLVGRPPNAPDVPPASADALPDLPPVPGTGIPSELLTRRPDVRAARRRVESADARIGVAIADFFPALRITASVGYNAGSITDLFDVLVWSILGSIAQPLFGGGRRIAELDRTRAALEERVHGFAQTFLEAMLEVENALAQEKRQLENIQHLTAQVEHTQAALREARSRYVQGLSDFLPVLTALQSSQAAEQALVQSKQQLLSFRIQLCRALGGTWTRELEAPEDPGKGKKPQDVQEAKES